MAQRLPAPSRLETLQLRAAVNRKHLTTSEAVLWAAIRGGRLGVSFRRQVVVGEYIIDFLCASARLVVEVDGGYHVERAAADGRRDRFLHREGYRVVRVAAEDVLRDVAVAVAAIARALEAEVA